MSVGGKGEAMVLLQTPWYKWGEMQCRTREIHDPIDILLANVIQ